MVCCSSFIHVWLWFQPPFFLVWVLCAGRYEPDASLVFYLVSSEPCLSFLGPGVWSCPKCNLFIIIKCEMLGFPLGSLSHIFPTPLLQSTMAPKPVSKSSKQPKMPRCVCLLYFLLFLNWCMLKFVSKKTQVPFQVCLSFLSILSCHSWFFQQRGNQFAGVCHCYHPFDWLSLTSTSFKAYW